MLMNILGFITTFAVAIYGIWVIVSAQLKKSRPEQRYQLWLLLGGIMVLCQVLFSNNRLLGTTLLALGCIVISVTNYLMEKTAGTPIKWRNHSVRALLELVLVVWAAFVG
ncbi:hypothetical protein [Furfurilactobacillus siliginis]|uniref:Uncharacterized protein n=1 Tax=Furfurilactobacillus siliginis TaxID=348151 RepID=A0A0R2L3M8_9LACO|nr:hypothetical protein [Furfurilactobacillus siliginis]KRN96376.1 hypothetical protein IV55_GL001339 [Furfurilactobacillus siliginis]GEK28999.1 hypothetical protein LSI01_13100 [Furfurilactobacillus siliginis]